MSPHQSWDAKFQYQICNSGPQERCSRVGGLVDLLEGSLTPTTGDKVISWIWKDPFSIMDVITDLRITSLTSRFNLAQSTQGRLPDNQWQIDVEYWHNIYLTSIQGNMLDKASGPGDAEILQYFWKRPETDTEKYFCENQVCKYVTYSFRQCCIFLVGLL